jgi:2',3'-cyclic-nucleotide 2'-phosphodiesterase (5'-nucleotidase family)
VLCANVTNIKDGTYPSGVRPYVVCQVGGRRIGVLGVTSFAISHAQGLLVDNGPQTAVALFPRVAQESDIVIALTHLGSYADGQLAKSLPELGCVVGGHSHTQLDQPLVEGHVPIVQAGSAGRRIDLYFDLQKRRWNLTRFSGKLIPIEESMPEDPETAGIIASYIARARK